MVVVVVCCVGVGHHVHCHQARRLAAGIPVARGTPHPRQVHTRLLQRHPANAQTQGGQRLGAPRPRSPWVFSPGRLQRVAFCPRKVASPRAVLLSIPFWFDLSLYCSVLVFMSAAGGRGFQIEYPSIILHAVSRAHPGPSIYCQLDENAGSAEQPDDDGEDVTELRELSILPQNESARTQLRVPADPSPLCSRFGFFL